MGSTWTDHGSLLLRPDGTKSGFYEHNTHFLFTRPSSLKALKKAHVSFSLDPAFASGTPENGIALAPTERDWVSFPLPLPWLQ